MTGIKIKQFMYPYGKVYDVDLEVFHPREGDHDIVVYTKIQNENRVIGSLEGVFVSSRSLIADDNIPFICYFADISNRLSRRDQMKDFENKYKGKFIPFGEEYK